MDVVADIPFRDKFCLYLEEKKADIKVRKKKEFLSHLEAKCSFENLKPLYDHVVSCLHENNFSRLLIFKEGIQPCWEDKRNKRGGNFTYYFDKPEDNQEKFLVFLRLVFQDQIMEYEELCGVIYSRESSYFQIWHADVMKEEALTSKLSSIISGYNLMKYRIHKKCIALNWLPVTQQKRASMPDKPEVNNMQERRRRNTFPGSKADIRADLPSSEESSPLVMKVSQNEHGLLPTPSLRPIISSLSSPPMLQTPSISPLQNRPTAVIPKLVVSEGESSAQTPADHMISPSTTKSDTPSKTRKRSKSKSDQRKTDPTGFSDRTSAMNRTTASTSEPVIPSAVTPEAKLHSTLQHGKTKRKSKDGLPIELKVQFEPKPQEIAVNKQDTEKTLALSVNPVVQTTYANVETSDTRLKTQPEISPPKESAQAPRLCDVNEHGNTFEQGDKQETKNIMPVDQTKTKKLEHGAPLSTIDKNPPVTSSSSSPSEPTHTSSRSLPSITNTASSCVVEAKPSIWTSGEFQSKALATVLVVLLVSLVLQSF